MAASPPKPWANDTLPLNIGWRYLLRPGYPSSDWVEIYALDNQYVYVDGVGRQTRADYKVLQTAFDDNVADYMIGGFFLLSEDGLSLLATEDNHPLLWS